MEKSLGVRRGMVADIQRFSLHDGPGIRTNVYLKGCNMCCPWCHNPEMIAFEPQVILDPEKCVHCGRCNEGCFSGARRVSGREMSVQQVMDEVMLDRDYYGEDGGLTLTGGEPTCQGAFALALLRLAREEGISCAMETNLTAPAELLRQLLENCRLLMCDIKLWDAEAHRRWTGLDNRAILENLRLADVMGLSILVRTPVVPGVNDSEENIACIAKHLSELRHLEAYELLPYHALGLSKQVEGCTPQRRFDVPSKTQMYALARVARSKGVPVRIAGVPFEEE